MLDINTLNDLYDLSANTLYSAEVKHLPKLSREAEAALVVRARQGDSEAREALIVSCLSYALNKAWSIYNLKRPLHDDLLDLAQEANLQMVEDLDQALTKKNPASYLRGIANRAIWQHCIYRSGLIRKPGTKLETLKKLSIPTVESLDAPIYVNEERIYMELIEAPAMQPEIDEGGQQKRYTALYKAFHSLSKHHQSILVRLYGLFGQPMETASEIGIQNIVHTRATSARKKLRALLVEYVQQMQADKTDEEE